MLRRMLDRLNIVLLRLIHQWAEDAERRAARRFLARVNAERAEGTTWRLKERKK